MPSYTPQKTTPYTVPNGKYKIDVVFAENKTSPTSGNEFIKMKCRVKLEDGEDGPVIFDNLMFTQKSADYTTEKLQSMGIAVVFGEPLTVEPEDVLGKEANVTLYLDDDGYMKIKKWHDPKDSANPTTSKPTKPASKQKDADGDEIPF